MSFGFVFDQSVLQHHTGAVQVILGPGHVLDLGPHPSDAAITANIFRLLQESRFLDHCTILSPRIARVDEIGRVHDQQYIARVRHVADSGGGVAGDVTPIGAHSYSAALAAAGCALSAVDAVLGDRVSAAYALTRPPGHHAMPGQAMGYCIFNNAAIAACHARSRGLERILILDWDVHHGNGTQAAFFSDPSVLYISIHQEDWYPRGSGSESETGSAGGEGFTINIPLPTGTGDRGYLEVIDTIVAPAARRFRPELIILSAGQDPAMLDPLGRMLVSGRGFYSMGARLAVLADELCGGKVVALQEGGYSLHYTPICTLFALEGLSGIEIGLQDPYAASTEQAYAEAAYSDATRAAIRRVIAAVSVLRDDFL